MKFNILKTRRGKLKSKLQNHLSYMNDTELETILEAIDEYEQANLATIEKLKKEKQIDTKKINGALKQSINAHGPITLVLIGSATKRIYGSLLENKPKETLLSRLKQWLK